MKRKHLCTSTQSARECVPLPNIESSETLEQWRCGLVEVNIDSKENIYELHTFSVYISNNLYFFTTGT
jgi:hypothetical protein